LISTGSLSAVRRGGETANSSPSSVVDLYQPLLETAAMRTIIAGSRSIHDYEALCEAIRESGFEISLVLSGAADGVDALGERYAREHNIPIERFPANWNRYGRAAGPMRNRIMAQNAEALIALMHLRSPGTKNMIQTAHQAGLKIHVKIIQQ